MLGNAKQPISTKGHLIYPASSIPIPPRPADASVTQGLSQGVIDVSICDVRERDNTSLTAENADVKMGTSVKIMTHAKSHLMRLYASLFLQMFFCSREKTFPGLTRRK